MLQIVPNLNSNFVALRSGAVDVGTLTAENVAQAERTADLRVLRTPENATQLLYLQTQAAPTRDVRVRRAIAGALDYAALASAWRNEFPAATSFLPRRSLRGKAPRFAPIRTTQAPLSASWMRLAGGCAKAADSKMGFLSAA